MRTESRAGFVRTVSLALVAAVAFAAVPASSQRVAFTTSVTGTGNLSTWPGAGGQVGLAAGDAACQARAAAAGLANPGNFVAWLSDSSDDAYCRLHGLTGTKAANCGQPSLPEAAGPWVRTDGMPFGAAIAELAQFNGTVFTPMLLDELGAEVPDDATAAVFTGTDAYGALDSNGSCANWTASAPQPVVRGTPFNTTNGWSSSGLESCAVPVRLACLEMVAGGALPAPATGLRRAFLSSASGAGELGAWPQADPGATGAAAGDSICRNLAQAAGFEEASSFKAWLSTGAADAVDRFVNDGPWETPNAVVVAYGLVDLTDGRLRSSIHVTEQGTYLGNYGVWTGTQDDGLRRPERCADWTSASGGDSGATGSSDRTIQGWSWYFGAANCDATHLHLYCLSDAPGPFFADGFEWATTAAWSAVAP